MKETTLKENILEGFDIPESRLDLTKSENVRWLLRNLGVRNRDNPKFKQVITILRKERIK